MQKPHLGGECLVHTKTIQEGVLAHCLIQLVDELPPAKKIGRHMIIDGCASQEQVNQILPFNARLKIIVLTRGTLDLLESLQLYRPFRSTRSRRLLFDCPFLLCFGISEAVPLLKTLIISVGVVILFCVYGVVEGICIRSLKVRLRYSSGRIGLNQVLLILLIDARGTLIKFHPFYSIFI